MSKVYVNVCYPYVILIGITYMISLHSHTVHSIFYDIVYLVEMKNMVSWYKKAPYGSRKVFDREVLPFLISFQIANIKFNL